MSLFPIFKVNLLTNKNNTSTIYVFYGSQFSKANEDPNDLFEENNDNPIFANVFTKDELARIQKDRIEVVFIDQTIHIDDSIGIIKLKLFDALGKHISMSEIYLYCLKDEKLNPITVYQNLTQNDKLPLTKVRMEQLILNLFSETGNPIDFMLDNKPYYSFDDILKLDLSERQYLVAKPLGQKIVFANEYPFVADPFMVTEYDRLLERSRREISTLSSNLLLEMGPIFRNTIYMCLAKDVLEQTDELGFSEYAVKLYYPFLYQEKIDSNEDLDTKRAKLIEMTNEKLTTNTERNFKNIDMFYDIFENRKASKNFSGNSRLTGITSLKVIIYPEFTLKIPIDVIFKLIHAIRDFPLIKFNPESGQENIYRLYAPELTMDGRKIPFLQKTTIFKLMKMIGKRKSVAVYTTTEYSGIKINMVCEFSENGIISVYTLDDFEKPILIGDGENIFENIDAIIRLVVNPLIEQIQPFFQQSGLVIPLFKSIQEINTEIRDLKLQTTYNVTKKININKFNGCISSVFIVETDNLKKNIQMRYKRVSNFNKRDSQEAFIIEKIDQGLKINEITEELLQQYDDLDESSAYDLIVKITTELEFTRGANRRRSLMIKINPGFKTVMAMNFITSVLTVTVSGINDIYYLNTIPVYLDTLVRITQDIDSSAIKSSTILKMCSGGEVEDINFDHITAQSEKPLYENEVPSFENETSVYEDESNKKDTGMIPEGDEEREREREREREEGTQELEEKGEEEEEGKYMDELLDLLGYDEENSSDLEGGVVNDDSDNDSDNDSFGDISSVGSQQSEEAEVEAEEAEAPIISVPPKIVKPIVSPVIKPNPNPNPNPKPVTKNVERIENADEPIIGMKLRYPNPFSVRLEERMPQLFVKAKDEKFDLYTRMCPFNLAERRQPVILTKEEKDRIIADHPDINQEAEFIEYGTDAKNADSKYYYTCPRYWCLLTDTMVTEKDILDGKCGPKVDSVEDAIIPRKADDVPKDRYVYKFYDENEKKYPGFHKQKMPSGLCIPCCYSNWETAEMKNRRDICQDKYDEKSAQPVSEKEKKIENELRKEVVDAEHYVKGPEKYGPQLGEHRWGFLPIVVQKFLQEVSEDCQISKTDTNLKPHHVCMLRHGVEVSTFQSFIACIASAIFYAQRDEKTKKPLLAKFLPNSRHDVPTIKEMKEIIINAIDIDKFIKYQNGDLITSFADAELPVDIEAYKSSKLYKKIKKVSIPSASASASADTELSIEFLKKVIQSFEKFKDFLRDDRIIIDYTYLWDLVTVPNPSLFENGINLIILEIPENDATNNIELVCPTNHYSSNIFDSTKRSLILIKRETYFEPVYGYKNDGKRIQITKTFNETDRKLPKSLRSVFTKIIKPTLGEKCRTFLSKPNEYRFKHPPILDKLIEELLGADYSVTIQVLNFQGKVIGVLARNREGLEGFIPCYPSALTTLKNFKGKKGCNEPLKTQGADADACEYDFVYMNDTIWKPYDQTLEFLKEYYDYEEPDDILKANCFNPKYFCRVVEDELVTGFLTNTNQFVPIKDPVPISSINASDNIKIITNNDMLVADMHTLLNNKVDSKRVEFIKKIQLETNYFNAFRNTIRILFNDYTNSVKRKEIQDECNKRYTLYTQQLNTIIEMLHALVGNNIIFALRSEGYDYNLVNENEIHTCITQSKDKCDVKGAICRITNDKCTLVLPKENLINDTDNEKYYYGKMADELIRYNRIKSFIFKPQSYLSFGQVKYNLRDDEIIILQDLLNNDFFEKMVPADINRYARYNTFDSAEPIVSQIYTNEIQLNDLMTKKSDASLCVKKDPQNIKVGYLNKCFPKGYKEIEYDGVPQCSLLLIIDILKKIKDITVTIEQVKDVLIEEYSKLTEHYLNKDRIDKIVDVLKEEGQFDVNETPDKINFERMIINDDFFAVNFDLWILLVKYEIPSVFISSRFIPETRFKSKEFVCYKTGNNTETEKFVFIITPGFNKIKKNDIKLPHYKIVVDTNNEIEIPLDAIRGEDCLSKINSAFDHPALSVEDYLDYVFEKQKPEDVVWDIVEEEQLEKKGEKEGEEKPKIKKQLKRKIDSKLKLEEAEEAKEAIDVLQPEPILLTNETITVVPAKKKLTRKQREMKTQLVVNQPRKKNTRKKVEDIVIDEKISAEELN